MQKYVCHNCDGLSCETSTCPICGKRTELIGNDIYFCTKCNSPSYDDHCHICNSECIRIASDIRPVFATERLLLEILLNKPFAFAGKSIWALGAGVYLVDGIKIRINYSRFYNSDPLPIIEKLNLYALQNQKYIAHDLDNEHIQHFIECNSLHLNQITDEAVTYIKNIALSFDLGNTFVSFSGGKDSTVTSHLAMKAFETESILHIYGDTTLEYPTSQTYIEEFKKRFPRTPLLVAKNTDQDFENLCEVVGPPSRVMRWCCTIFKTGAITKKIEQTFKNKTRLLSFQGIRRAESLSRSKYDRDTDSPKISKQVVSAPIIDWADFDVWLYILANKIPFNGAYRQGFSRVGCWCCPNNSNWSAFLSSVFMNKEYVRFKEMLYTFAKKIGKSDWKDYIDEGGWKARQGGNGLEHSKNAVVSFKPCAFDEQSFNYSLLRPISEELYTMFKPFGIINTEIGNKRLGEVYILSKSTLEPFLKLTGRIGMTELRVTVIKLIPLFKNMRQVQECVNNQITKFQTCIGCSYCQSVCKFNALKVINSEKGNVSSSSVIYTIDTSKCTGCLECVRHFDGGCYMKKVLRTKKEKTNG